MTFVPAGTCVGYDTIYEGALIIGDSYATALVVEGGVGELTEFVDRLRAALALIRAPLQPTARSAATPDLAPAPPDADGAS